MRIIYSTHLKKRLSERQINPDLPRTIFKNAKERFYDHEEDSLIAVMKIEHGKSLKEAMIAYIYDQKNVIIKTIHLLRKNQKTNRIANGRWEKIK